MEAVIEKLAEIERTAEAIVEEAQAQKRRRRSPRSRRRYRQSGMRLTSSWKRIPVRN